MSKFENLSVGMFNCIGDYDIPYITPVTELPNIDWVRFTYCKSMRKDRDKYGVHFFVEDYQFERVWNFPERYLDMLKQYKVVLTPDYSLYTDFPFPIQLYNHYRKHWLGAYWQSKGITVIPTISWSDESSYDWCFDGEPIGGIVAVSTTGCMKNDKSHELFIKGYNEMIERLQPKQVLMFGRTFDDNYKGNVTKILWNMYND